MLGITLCEDSLFQATWAHDFGGPTTPNPPDNDPPQPPPCKEKCCEGSGGGGGGGGGNPPQAGDPVSLLDGAERHSVTDLTVNGLFPIIVRRTYDSQSQYDTPLGYGWAFQHDRRLFEYSDGSVIIRRGCGHRNRYVFTGGSYVTPDDGVRGQLTEKSDGSFEFAYYDGTFDTFDAEGRLTAEVNRQGSRHEYLYVDTDLDGRPDKLPLIGTSPHAVDPTQPLIVAYVYRLARIQERGADGTLSGRFVDFSYDEQTGRLTQVTSDDGRSVRYQHDLHPGSDPTDPTDDGTRGNLTQVERPGNSVHAYQYADANDDHNLTTIQEGVGRTPYVNTYDVQDRVIEQRHGVGKLVFAYPIDREKTVLTRTVADAAGNTLYTAQSIYEFETSGFVKHEIDALGHETHYQYDSANNLIRWERWQKQDGTLSLLQAIDYTYDTQGNRTRQTVALGGGETLTTTWTYQQGWVGSEQTVSSAAPGKIFRTEYTFYTDAAGRPTNIKEMKRRRSDGSFQTTTYTYDSRNRRLTTAFPDGIQRINEYAGGSLFVTRTAYQATDGSAIPHLTQRFAYDTRGNLTEVWDGANNRTSTVFDIRNRPTTVTNALGEQTLFTYVDDDLVQLESGRSGADAGQVTKLTYNAEGRPTAIQRQDDSGAFILYQSFTYDSEGRRLSVTDALGRTTRFAYDALGQLTQLTDPTGRANHFGYDAAGNRVHILDAANRETISRYDARNRLVETEQRGITPPAVSRFGYDAVGNLTSVTDPKNNTTSYEYDALSRRTAEIRPLGQRLEFDYDDRDRLIEQRNARQQKIVHAYAPWGGLLNTRYYASASAVTPERTQDYEYDLAGNLTSIDDDSIQPTPLYTIEYDALNRPSITTTHYLPGGPVTLQSAYDRYGNRQSLTLNDGETLVHTYTFDRLDRLSGATLPPNQTFDFEYDASGELKTRAYPNGVETRFSYEANGPLKTLSTTTSAQITLQDRLYTYDASLNIDTITDTDGLYEYGYDGLDRLTETTPPAATALPDERYAYDPVGNREDPNDSQRYGYDANNRIQQGPNLTYTFDADGNLATRGDGATFAHDASNRLRQFTHGSQLVSYQYDPLGRRIAKNVNGQVTWYLWDQSRLLAEYDGSGNRLQHYGYLPGDYMPVQTTRGARTYNIHGDHLQTPRLLTDSDEQIAWRARYESFGNAVVESDVDGDGTPITFNFRLPGQYYDEESGLHYNYYRDYDPATGRYVQSDPIGLKGGLNSYMYGDANPLVAIDALGLECIRFHNPGYPKATPTGRLRYGKLINSERIYKYGLGAFEICYRTWVRSFYKMEELYEVTDRYYLKCWDDCGNYTGSFGGGKDEWVEWRPAGTKHEDYNPSAWKCPKRDPYGPTPPDFPDLNDLDKNHPPTASP